MDRIKPPVQLFNWHLEISSKCALLCSRCSRTEERGTFPETQLGLDFIRRLFQPEFLRSQVCRITFSGGLGDAIYNTELLDIVGYLKKESPDTQLVLVTNGSHKASKWWHALAGQMNHNDEVIFSIDGWDQQSNELYRKSSDWNSIMRGLEIMGASPVQTRWSTIVFRFNEDRMADIETLAEKSGADQFHIVLSERFGAFYRNPETGDDPLEPRALKSLSGRNQRFKTRFPRGQAKLAARRPGNEKFNLRQRSHQEAALAEYGNATIFPTCAYGYRGLYVDVGGFLYPCSWVAHPYKQKQSRVAAGKVQSYSEGFARFRDRIDLKTRSLQDILQDPLWMEWSHSWRSPRTADVICENKCRNGACGPDRTLDLKDLKAQAQKPAP